MATTYDEETLMAYADGELDEAMRAEIAMALDKDPDLARRVAAHRALRAEIAGAYSGVLDQPLPDRLRAAARGAATSQATPEARTRGNVVQFPARTSRAPAAPWRAREWLAVAASLVLGFFVATRLLPDGGLMENSADGLVARGDLLRALDSQLAGEQPASAPVRIGLSFRDQSGAYCRSFFSGAASTAGYACRHDSEWRIEQTNAVEPGGGELRQAASMPPALLQAIEARIAGEPLDAAGEKAAREAGWGTPALNGGG